MFWILVQLICDMLMLVFVVEREFMIYNFSTGHGGGGYDREERERIMASWGCGRVQAAMGD